MSNKNIERLKEIIRYAAKLDWLEKPKQFGSNSYPTMQLSEVEKCMLAMIDDSELERLKRWAAETDELSMVMAKHSERFGKLCEEKRKALEQTLVPNEKDGDFQFSTNEKKEEP